MAVENLSVCQKKNIISLRITSGRNKDFYSIYSPTITSSQHQRRFGTPEKKLRILSLQKELNERTMYCFFLIVGKEGKDGRDGRDGINGAKVGEKNAIFQVVLQIICKTEKK